MKTSSNRAENPTPEQFAQLGELVQQWTTIPDIAEAMDVIVTRVHSLVDDGAVLAFRDPADGVRRIPADFTTQDGRPLEALHGTVSVLRDAGFTDLEAAIWLLSQDDSLPGRPIDFLHAGRKTEIRRRAQAMAW
ncbi:Rv2175c family DNA-binding protein [Kocuria sp.]|uniref:Rv2175c family DNA-binding protein n=1 Tax=Kocuria sp. TaxID=1871328 RepID=UPI0026DF545F|nr:Rv2175c family DNA-binding protein [Kocuria sp.]MDO5618464.1 Rv2175c family DNA-binding protein [Kocuria sp.]